MPQEGPRTREELSLGWTDSWSLTGETVIGMDADHLAIALEPGAPNTVIATIDGDGVEIQPRDSTVIFLPAGTSMTVQSPMGAARGIAATVPIDAVSRVVEADPPRWRIAIGERAPRIAETVRWLHWNAGKTGPDVLVAALLARLLARTFGGITRRADDSWLPAAALARISTRTSGEDLASASIGSLAAEVGLGKSAFSRAFRGSTGRTPGTHLAEARLGQVAQLLATTDLPLGEIARRVGLASVAHLSQQFSSRHGMGVRRFRATKGDRRRPKDES